MCLGTGVDGYTSDYPGAENYAADPTSEPEVWTNYTDEMGISCWYVA